MVCFMFILKDLLELCGTLIKNTNSNKTMKKKKKKKKKKKNRRHKNLPVAGIEPRSVALKVRVFTTILAALCGKSDKIIIFIKVRVF